MAYEAAIRERIEDPIDFTVADGTGIEKGAVLKLTDPRTAIITSAQNDQLAGIAAREKVANDGRTRLAVYRRGIFDMTASGAITVGDTVASAGVPANQVIRATIATSGAAILGTALETASDTEVIQIYVDIGSGGMGHAVS